MMNSTLRKRLAVPIAVVGFVVVALLAVPTTREEAHWWWARRTGTPAAYDSYIQTWGEGRHVAEARILLDVWYYMAAQDERTIEGFERYLQQHPDGIYRINALYDIDDLQWEQAIATDTVDALELYLRNAPEGRYQAEATDKIDDLRWQLAVSTKSRESFETYLRPVTTGKYWHQAHEMIDEIDWQRALESDTLASYRRYLASPQPRRFSDQAGERIAALPAPFPGATYSGTTSSGAPVTLVVAGDGSALTRVSFGASAGGSGPGASVDNSGTTVAFDYVGGGSLANSGTVVGFNLGGASLAPGSLCSSLETALLRGSWVPSSATQDPASIAITDQSFAHTGQVLTMRGVVFTQAGASPGTPRAIQFGAPVIKGSFSGDQVSGTLAFRFPNDPACDTSEMSWQGTVR